MTSWRWQWKLITTFSISGRTATSPVRNTKAYWMRNVKWQPPRHDLCLSWGSVLVTLSRHFTPQWFFCPRKCRCPSTAVDWKGRMFPATISGAVPNLARLRRWPLYGWRSRWRQVCGTYLSGCNSVCKPPTFKFKPLALRSHHLTAQAKHVFCL